MNQDKLHLINKIFNNETIRTIWDKEVEKYFISVVDVVGVITQSKDGRVITSVKDTSKGDSVVTILKDGVIISTVEEVEEK